jgi:nucleoside-diphosphate-sugar epimerase
MKKVLITGANGFLGSHVVKLLIKKNYKIFATKRKNSNLIRLKSYQQKIIFLKIDNLDKYFSQNQFNLVIHCATNYGTNDKKLSDIIFPNLTFPLKLLELCEQYHVKTFINTDTILPKNISGYTLSKFQFYEWMKKFSEKINCINVKIEHFFGPGDNKTKFVISNILNLINKKKFIYLTKGKQKRDFIYIDDVISAFDKIILWSNKKRNGLYNFEIGTNKLISIKNFMKLLKKLTNNEKTILRFGYIPYRKEELMTSKVNNNNLIKLGWRPKNLLTEGLKKTIKYYSNF